MTRPKLLDLYCGAGGASAGYVRAGFDVTGIDINPQPQYPFAFVQEDALVYLAAHGHEYDFIHASPPCEHYSKMTPISHRANHPNMIPPTREVLRQIGRPYIIENVPNARRHLINPLMLCGSMFALPIPPSLFRVQLGRYVQPVQLLPRLQARADYRSRRPQR